MDQEERDMNFPPEAYRDDEFRDTFGEGEQLDEIFNTEDLTQLSDLDEIDRTGDTPALPTDSTPEVTEDEEPKEKKPPTKKGRPRRKGKYGLLGIPHILATAVWLAIILIIGVTVGRMVWLCATDVLAFGREPIEATVTIEQGDTIEVVAEKLKEAGLIRFTELFGIYADLTHAEAEIRPGTYHFNPPEEDQEKIVYDYMALVSVLSPSAKTSVVEDLRIPEGYTCAQIFQLLEDNNVCTVQELEDCAVNGDLGDYWFLEGVERNDRYCLEGYLFPNTYDFYQHDDPERVIKKMLNAFNANFTENMRNSLATLNDTLEDMMRNNGYGKDYIEANKFTVREVVIVASMIEKETANNAESFKISSVIYNRLTNASKFPFLNIDATLVYALGGRNTLTEQDKKIDSPYNTYTEKGLIPGPISNPSQNSLAAALQPEATDYYYYAYDPSTEEHHFSKTYDEHLDFLASLKEAE